MVNADPRYATLHLSIWIFAENARDAIRFLQALAEPTTFIQIFNDPLRLEETQYEAARLLHNFLASASSLVDHSRNIIEKAASVSAPVPMEYRNRVDEEFGRDPLHRFVRGLRNYTLHQQLPLTGAGMSITRKASGDCWDPRAGLWLDMTVLAQWDKWDPLARGYIASSGDSLDLLKLVRTYSQKVLDLHSWLFERNRAELLPRRARPAPEEGQRR